MRSRGISLLEWMLVLAIGGLIAAFAIPSFTTLIADARRTAALNAFVTSIQLARTEAIKHADEVVLCKDGGGDACTTAGEWERGWLVFANLDHDAPPQLDPGEPLIQQCAALPAARLSANRAAFTFRPFARASTNGTATYCDGRGAAAARAIIVSLAGRPRIADVASDGGALTCPEP
jgi:type IV fimbrial biogenesis protein FimT